MKQELIRQLQVKTSGIERKQVKTLDCAMKHSTTFNEVSDQQAAKLIDSLS